jgi:hypothetical protein
MLDELLEHTDQLTDDELSGFDKIRRRMEGGDEVTETQREWMQNVYSRNKLDQQDKRRPMERQITGSVASGKRSVKSYKDAGRFGPLWWERSENRPLLPPNRMGPGDTSRPNID